MPNDNPRKSEELAFDDLRHEFLSLRVGEEIPRLEIARIRKVTNPDRTDNLSGVDFKYIIEDTDGKLLTVNSWMLWRKISAAVREAGRIKIVLELKHPAVEEYSVRLIQS